MRLKRLLFLLILTTGICLACPVMVHAATTDADGNRIIVITIDPGHGGTESGDTEHYDGKVVKESDLTWKIANYCKQYLEENYWNVEVHLTRGANECPDLKERVQTAVDYQSDFLLSIHLNAYSGSTQGAMSLVPSGNYMPQQAAIATAVGDQILRELASLGITNRGPLIRYSNDYWYPNGSRADYYGIVRHGVQLGVPSIIMEHAFLDNRSDYYSFLSTDAKLQAIGEADARGLAQQLGLEEMSKKPVPRVTSAIQGDTPFTDVYVGVWYYDDVTFVYEQKLMSGVSDTSFAPNTATTRGMVATLLYRLEGVQESATDQHFTDVSAEDWYYESVEWAAEAGLAQGYENGTFQPKAAVTREQMVTFLYRYALFKGYDCTATCSLEDFRDSGSISDYALEAMEWAVAVGLVQGVDADLLDPQGATSRNQLAALFHRYILTVVDAAVETEPEPDPGTDLETKPETDTETDLNTEPETDTDIGTGSDPETAPASDQEADNSRAASAVASDDALWAAYLAKNNLIPVSS
jgi:hypothetical protein